jgi:hypothetical protein
MSKVRIYQGMIYGRSATVYEDGNKKYACYYVGDEVIWLLETTFGQWRVYAVTKDDQWRPWS